MATHVGIILLSNELMSSVQKKCWSSHLEECQSKRYPVISRTGVCNTKLNMYSLMYRNLDNNPIRMSWASNVMLKRFCSQLV